jgi:hypothetical protein
MRAAFAHTWRGLALVVTIFLSISHSHSMNLEVGARAPGRQQSLPFLIPMAREGLLVAALRNPANP